MAVVQQLICYDVQTNSAVSMNSSALKIGDQLILEEDYDENYIPSEQGLTGTYTSMEACSLSTVLHN